MGRYVVKLAENKFIEWSSVVDAPVSAVMTKQEAVEESYKQLMTLADVGKEYIEKYRREEAEARINRADEKGTSCMGGGGTLESILSYNRAGENETQIKTVEELIEVYTYTEDKKDKFPWRNS